MFRVVCVGSGGEVGRAEYGDGVRALGEYRHCRRTGPVFAGLFEKRPGARHFVPVRLYEPEVEAAVDRDPPRAH